MSSSITNPTGDGAPFLQRSNKELPEPEKPFQLLVDSVLALVRGKQGSAPVFHGQRNDEAKETSCEGAYHGCRTFSDLLADAEKHGIIRVRTDSRSGTYVVVGFGEEK
jgi:hypothetical protein